MKNLLLVFIIIISYPFFSQSIIAQYEIINKPKEVEKKKESIFSKESEELLNAFKSKPSYYQLYHHNGISIFESTSKEEELNLSSEDGSTTIKMQRLPDKSKWYKDFNNNSKISHEYIFDKDFLINEPIESFHWTLEDEEKKIGEFHCKKATTQFNGEQLTAYYTEEIPIFDGPKYFCGLPGLIIELEDSKVKYYITELKITDNITEIKPPTKGKSISRVDFEILKEKKFNEPPSINTIMIKD